MTAEPDLLPCPGCNGASVRVIGGSGTKGVPQYWAGCDRCRWRMWGNTEADAIAAWNTRATAARDAEIEALRAEVERLKALVRSVGYETLTRAEQAESRAERLAEEVEALRAQLDEQCRLHAIGMERELALITERDRLRVELGCLQQQYDERTAYMIVHRGAALACSDSVRAAYSDEHHRAERLAEALRNSSDALERLAFAIRAPNAHTPQLVELAIAMRAAALEAFRDGTTSPVTSPVRILIDAIESEIRQLEGTAAWKSQAARIASLRAAIDAVRENNDA